MNQSYYSRNMIRMWRNIILVLGVVIILLAIGIGGINGYLQSNKTKLINKIALLNGGTASFSSLKVNVLAHFPSISITLDSLLLTDSLYGTHQKPLIDIERLEGDISLKSIFQNTVEFKQVRFLNGEINIYSDPTGYSNMKSFVKPPKPTRNPRATQQSMLKISPRGLNIQLVNTQITYVNIPKHKNMSGYVNELDINVQSYQEELSARIRLDISNLELAFNTEKGSFLNKSQVNGNLDVYLEEGLIHIPRNNLYINDQIFVVGADIFTDHRKSFDLYINNPVTDFDKTLRLLPRKIQEDLSAYKVLKPFPAHAVITGKIGPGHAPEVDVDFKLENNQAKLQDFQLEDLSMQGRLHVRRKYQEQLLGQASDDALLEANYVTTRLGMFQLNTPGVLLTFRGEEVNIKTGLHIEGKASTISEWVDSEEYIFDQGDFKLEARLNGSLNRPEELLISSYADLQFNNIDIIYKPANVAFRFDQIRLDKKAGDASFSLVSSYLNPSYDFTLDGQLKNFPSLVLDSYQGNTQSSADLRINKLSWEQFIDYFGTNGHFSSSKLKSLKEKKKTIKETVSSLYHYFQPEIIAAIDTLEFLDLLEVTNFSTGIRFKDEHTLILEKTTFYNHESSVSLSAELDLSKQELTPFSLSLRAEHLNLQELLPRMNYFGIKLLSNLDSLPTDVNLYLEHKGVIIDTAGLIQDYNKGYITFNDGKSGHIQGNIQYKPTPEGLDTQIQMEGKPELVNQFLDSKEFLFQGGRFEVSFAYVADVDQFDRRQLLEEAQARLSITGSEIHYEPVDVIFPLHEMWVEANQDRARFKVDLNIDSTQSNLELTGNLQNLHAYLLRNQEKAPEQTSFQLEAEAYSSKLHWEDLKVLTQVENQNKKEYLTQTNIQETIKVLLNTLHPSITLKLDTFVYSPQFMLEELYTGLYMKDSNILVLDKTGFTFHEGTMDVNANVDLSNPHFLPFEIEMNTDDLDLGSMMHSLNYLNIETLEETDKLEGRLSMKLELESMLDIERQSLVTPETSGKFIFDIDDIELKGLQALDTLAGKILMKQRLEELKFAPISGTIIFDGDSIKIPVMEIQSNAIHFFLEGDIILQDSSNVWISIPLHNLMKTDLETIPPKTGYALAGNKVYVEIESGVKGENQFKFRTSKKKYYEERGILPQFKVDKRRYRKLRKVLRRERRNKISQK